MRARGYLDAQGDAFIRIDDVIAYLAGLKFDALDRNSVMEVLAEARTIVLSSTDQ